MSSTVGAGGFRLRLVAGQKILVVGGFQRGKTTLVKLIVRLAPAVLVWDTANGGEFGAKDGFTPCRLDQVRDAIKRGARRIAVRIPPGQDPTKLFDDFCKLAFTLHGWVIVIDELSKVITSASPSEMGRYLWFSTLWREAHKNRSSVIIATHRLNEVPVLLREVHHFIQFGCRARVDLKEIERDHGEEAAAAVRDMAPFGYLYVGVDQIPRVVHQDAKR